MNKIDAEVLLKALEEAHNGIAIVSQNGTIEWINNGFANLIGYNVEEIRGKKSSEIFGQLLVDEGEKFFPKKELITTSDTVSREIYCNRKDGTSYWAKVSFFSICDEKGDLKNYVVVCTEITEIKKTRHRFSSLFEHNPHPVYYFDLEGNFLGANKKTEEVSAYTEEELLSMNFAPIIVEEDLERTVRHFEKAASGSVQEYEIKIKTKDGEIKDLRVTNFPMKVSDEIVGVFGIAEDITTRKKAAADLKRSEQKWQHLVEENPQAVQVTVGGIIIFINEAGAQLYGAEKPEEVVGRSVFEFSHPDYMKGVEERIAKLEKGLKVEQLIEHKIVLMNGETRYVEVNSIPISYQGEDAIQTVLHDITDRKKKESMIEAALVEKEVLLKEIHHRVKNNMAVISGLLELQSMNTKHPDLQVLLKESKLRIFSMAMIHEKLYQTETFADIEFGEYVKELIDTITNTIDVPTKEVSVTFNLEPIRLNINQAIPSALILNEIVVNSFKHAFKGQESGNVNISIRQIENNIILKVKDDGIGLPDDFKVENHQSLGTTLIDTLTKQLHGDLSMAAGPDGKGTLVEVSFVKDS